MTLVVAAEAASLETDADGFAELKYDVNSSKDS